MELLMDRIERAEKQIHKLYKNPAPTIPEYDLGGGSVNNCIKLDTTVDGINELALVLKNITGVTLPVYFEQEIFISSSQLSQFSAWAIANSFTDVGTGTMGPWDDESWSGGTTLEMQWFGSPTPVGDQQIYWDIDSLYRFWLVNTTLVTPDVWQLVEWFINVDNTFDLYVDNSLVIHIPADKVGGSIDVNQNWYFGIANQFPNTSCYMRNVHAGTTRHGTDIFSGTLVGDFDSVVTPGTCTDAFHT